MSVVNVQSREVAAKVVFYGPGLSGKTTTLQRIYERVKPTARGELMALATEGDRTLFFDFLPVKVERIRDFALRLGLYTVPGQVFYNATRKLVLQGADGVVFVADSQPDALDRNIESLENLRDNLEDEGRSLASIPLVIQYNKRDLRQVMPVEELRRLLNTRGVPDVESAASTGMGVMETLRAVTKLVVLDLQGRDASPSRPLTPVRPQQGPSPTLAGQLQAHLAEPVADPLAPPPAAPTPATAAPSPVVEPMARDAAELEPQPWSPSEASGSPGWLSRLAGERERGRVLQLERALEERRFGDVLVGVRSFLVAQVGASEADWSRAAWLLGLDGPACRVLLRPPGAGVGEREAMQALVLVGRVLAQG